MYERKNRWLQLRDQGNKFRDASVSKRLPIQFSSAVPLPMTFHSGLQQCIPRGESSLRARAIISLMLAKWLQRGQHGALSLSCSSLFWNSNLQPWEPMGNREAHSKVFFARFLLGITRHSLYSLSYFLSPPYRILTSSSPS